MDQSVTRERIEEKRTSNQWKCTLEKNSHQNQIEMIMNIKWLSKVIS